ncbi:MAG: hypothetical protein RL660_464 [Bacteroidota bacterium]|jgi:hypothetical protein
MGKSNDVQSTKIRQITITINVANEAHIVIMHQGEGKVSAEDVAQKLQDASKHVLQEALQTIPQTTTIKKY